jgi:hypothetical protein
LEHLTQFIDLCILLQGVNLDENVEDTIYESLQAMGNTHSAFGL